MATETAYANLHLRQTGAQQWANVGNIITGLNQGLQLMERGLSSVTKAAKTFVDTGSQFERFNIQFETMLGSAEAANKRVKELFDFAAKTPFDLPGVIQAGKQMEAFGMYSSRALQAAGDAAAGFDRDMTDAVRAIASAVTGQTEVLQGFGITTADVAKRLGHQMTRTTKEGVEEATQAIIEIMEERFGGAMGRLAKSYSGMISNLGDAWIQFKLIVADSGPFETAKDIFGTILEGVNRLFASGEGERLGLIVGDTIASIMQMTAIQILNMGITLGVIADDIAGLVGKIREPVRGAWGWLRSMEAKTNQLPQKLENWLFPETDSTDIGAREIERHKQIGRMALRLGLAGISGGLTWIGAGGGGVETMAPGSTDNPIIAEAIRIRDEMMAQWRAGRRAAAPGAGGAAAGGAPPAGTWSGTVGQYGISPQFARLPYGAFGQAVGAGFAGLAQGPEMDPLELGKRQQEAEEEAADARARRDIERVDRVTGIMASGWHRYYRTISKYSQEWGKIERANLRDIRTAMGEAARGALIEWLQLEGQKFQIKAGEQVAMAISSAASLQFGQAAVHAAAAAKWIALTALTGVAAAGIELGGAGGDRYQEHEGSGSADGTRSIVRSQAGVKAQSVTYNLYVIHNATAVYGSSDGIRELFEREFMPLLEERGVAFA